MARILLDSTQAPLFTFIIDGTPTVEQLREHLREYQEILNRDRPLVVLFDTTNAMMVDAMYRKVYADFLNANTERMSRLIKGMAFVITSALLRGALTAVLWRAPLPYPHKTFHKIDEARTWLRSKI